MQKVTCLKLNSLKIISFFMFILVMSVLSFKNFLLFHTIIELLTILTALSITAISLHINYMKDYNDLLSLFGIAYFFIATFDLLHTLAYQGMNVFSGNTANLATQLWIIPRYLEGFTFLISSYFIAKKLDISKAISIYSVISLSLLASVFMNYFPECFNLLAGLTPFKIISEYLISAIFIVSGILLYRKRNLLANDLVKYLLLACATTCFSELLFTLYHSVYGLYNMAGHLFKLASYYYIYKALIKIKLEEPYQRLERLNEKLKQEIIEKNAAIEIRLKMEHELQKISRLQSVGNLAGGIAHDFNNVLTIILGNVSLAKRYLKATNKIYDRLLEIEEASHQGKDLAKQLLTYSKGGTPNKEVVDITKLTKEGLTFALSGSNVESVFAGPPEKLLVEVDTGQFKQILNNLVLNSIQAMPRGGKISVAISSIDVALNEGLPLQEGKYVKLSIRDEGIGIPKDQIEQIFDPFFTTKNDGHGLGLTTVYSIIEKHNGYVTLDSQLKKGTVFYIYLPLSTKQIISGSREINQNIISGTYRGKILVMDDEELIRNSLGNMLNYLGFQVCFAPDGDEAIKLYQDAQRRNNPFDCVILDLTIPGGIGGYDTNQKLLRINPNLLSIVSSGYVNNHILADYRQYGFKAFLKKPYKLEDLYSILDSLNLQNAAKVI